MAITLNDNIKINAGKPSEYKYLNELNIPYSGTGEVVTKLTPPLRYVGLTVNINGDEWWFNGGITDGDLVLKSQGGGSASGDRIEKTFYQPSHGFILSQVLEYSGGTFQPALAVGGRNSEIIGWVTDIVDVDNFTLVMNGYVSGITGFGLAANTTYYLSNVSGGTLTSVEPTVPNSISKPILTTLTADEAVVFNYRGFLNTTGVTSPEISGFTYAQNIGSGEKVYNDTITGTTLEFRRLSGRTGIDITTTGGTIYFDVTVTGGTQNIYFSKRILTGSTTLLLSDHIVLVSAATTITITLPTVGLTDGQAYKIKDVANAFTNNITIDGNGIDIEGFSTALINTQRGAIEIMYDLYINEWIILNYTS